MPLKLAQKCEHCGKEPSDGQPAVEDILKVVPAVGDRIRSMELMGKIALGANKELTVENVRQRLAATLDLIDRHCDSETARTLRGAMREVWK